uniref:Uncharacterized protein n=1 Tax=Arundo donax TaxID=35708 RepID=A0A0A9ATR6_ARUDO
MMYHSRNIKGFCKTCVRFLRDQSNFDVMKIVILSDILISRASPIIIIANDGVSYVHRHREFIMDKVWLTQDRL